MRAEDCCAAATRRVAQSHGMPIEREVGGVTVGRGVDGVVQESLAVGHVGLGCGIVVGGM